MAEFESFPKIARLSRECVITEKIDGTNAQVFIDDDCTTIVAGSRNRFITPGKDTDNAGFAGWVEANKAELLKLGPGRHFGEWWGAGIGRRYGLTEKRFSLFNVDRWTDDVRPACCGIVPVLYRGLFRSEVVDGLIDGLRASGSMAALGFMQPEGVVVFHYGSRTLFKKTLEKDDQPKGKADA